MKIGDAGILRQNTVPENCVPDLRPVWIFDSATKVVGPHGNCPLGPAWIDCAVHLRGHRNDLAVVPADCEFVLDIPAWKPSPDSAAKRRMAAKILKELQKFG